MVECIDSAEFKACSAQRDKKADKKIGKIRRWRGRRHIDAVAGVDDQTPIGGPYRALPFEGQAAKPQLVTEARFVGRFEQARSPRAMHLDERTDHRLGFILILPDLLIFLFHPLSIWAICRTVAATVRALAELVATLRRSRESPAGKSGSTKGPRTTMLARLLTRSTCVPEPYARASGSEARLSGLYACERESYERVSDREARVSTHSARARERDETGLEQRSSCARRSVAVVVFWTRAERTSMRSREDCARSIVDSSPS
jgi:hypothetical protein